nr:ABC transporter permease [Sansalvadorimonas sp. 2012CJ34-2]
MRAVDLLFCLNQAGPKALGILSLLSVLVGMILAYLGMIQLSQFGAEVYVANLVALGMVREMGSLMTAVIMAGRTGAAWASELGAMQVNEEVDALKTMGIRPMDFLVMPRLLAMAIAMPLLSAYSFILGMIGGGVMTTGMEMTLRMYLHQLLQSFSPGDVLAGCFKGFIFGLLIVLAGCQSGMNCRGSSAAVGEATTRAVVQAIVYFVIADAALNLMFYKLGI